MRISDWSSDVCSSDLSRDFTFPDRRVNLRLAGGSRLERRRGAHSQASRQAGDQFHRNRARGRIQGTRIMTSLRIRLFLLVAAATAIVWALAAAWTVLSARADVERVLDRRLQRSEEHTSELQSLMRI